MSSMASPTLPANLGLLISNLSSFVNVKLDSTNFIIWKTQLQNILRATDLLDILDGSSSCPSPFVRDSTGKEIPNPEFSKWKMIDNHLLSCVTATLSQSISTSVLHLKTSSEIHVDFVEFVLKKFVYVCIWAEDWDYNKIVICNRLVEFRCQIAVHQECYGANNIQDFTSWVCRACKTPNVERECCLCPVKGGALKPTDVDSLWVHVTCAWFRPEVAFVYVEKMEPAVGLLRIPSHSFVKVQPCVICKQTHGSCTQCYKCATSFHSMCALRAGYRMEVSLPCFFFYYEQIILRNYTIFIGYLS
ncbi:protein Jade-1-like [Camellia sinensis]|uniref:protein Jade-1-like n=1 Tax=Camellia sinensis TaxID=4442 RepID=UPI0010357EC6|nr:protein Jade-1-like [Camellia sinensis]